MPSRVVRSLSLLCLFCLFASFIRAVPAGQDPAIMQKVEALLSQMTLEEKVGQVSQINIFYLMNNEWGRGGFSDAKLKKVLVDYAVGSILSSGSGYPDQNTPQNWAKMTNMVQQYTEQTRLKIPVIYGVDAVHGHNNVKGAVIFPYDINVAASFNAELAEKSAELTGAAVRATGVHWNFAPVLDIARNPKWGRTYETFGEDPYLASILGARMIQGMQKNNQMAASAKHYLAYGAAENGLDRQPADVSERTLREIMFPPFKAAIDAGAKTVMVNSGELNGVPAHASKWLLQDILRKEFGFQGMVVSDWQDLLKIYNYHKAAPSLEAAVARSYNAGIDMNMMAMTVEEIDALKAAVQDGLVPMARLDDAVKRVLYLKYELGLFDNRYADETKAAEVIGDPEQQQVARELARQSLILLKNQSNTLPFSKDVKKVLVAGITADSKSQLCGGWTIDWQGAQEQDLIVGQTILAAIKAKLPAAEVKYVTETAGHDNLLQAAQEADVIIAAIGEKAYAETPGDVENLAVAQDQRAMLQALKESKKPIGLVVVAGRPLIIDWEAQNIPAIVYAFLPGTEGGAAISDVLFGDYNPAGRLPVTIPASMGQLPVRYNDRITASYKPLYAFGYGLSYTNFRYKNPQWPTSVKQGEPLKITVAVENTGKLAGDDVVLVYYTNEYASVTPRRAQLCGFQRVSLQPGEIKTVTFEITPAQLSLYNEDLQFVEELRPIIVQIGRLYQRVEIVAASAASAKYKNGVYEVQDKPDGEGYYCKAQVTIANDQIVGVEWNIYDRPRNDRLFDETYEGVFAGNALYQQQCRDDLAGAKTYGATLIKTQDLGKVDAISGATWSNKKFKKIMEMALEQAKQ